ncbi:unnamed protein product [Polarella glacialis]|uniref:Protein kinase domain-containing protein n=1 Tax=Polarella glacialis TaxID=89957 RepID=A0A813LPJ2_POLGL|nr:unnamed protein product [Polarella glacialis]CAE8735014.1 unnamed protein product [Polarella glacialis]
MQSSTDDAVDSEVESSADQSSAADPSGVNQGFTVVTIRPARREDDAFNDMYEDLPDRIQFFPERKRLQVLGRIPVRFRQDEMEQAFLKEQLSKLNRVVLITGRIGTFLIVVFALMYDLILNHNLKDMRRAHMIQLSAQCLGTALGLIMSVRMKFTEAAVLAIYSGLVIAVLMTHRYRAAYMGGEDEIIAEVYPNLPTTALTTDSFTIVYISLLLASFYASPVRCTRGVFMIATTPIIYLAFTLPMPAEKFEGGTSRVCEMAIHLAAVALFCSIGRSNVEVAERLEFLRRQLLEATVTKEKTLRFAAEHEVERGPFSSLRRCTGDNNNNNSNNKNYNNNNAEASSSRGSGVQSHTLSSIIFSRNLPVDPQLQFEAMREVATQEQWNIEAADLQHEPHLRLGVGGYGAVFHGQYLGTDAALKVPLVEGLGAQLHALGGELRTLRRIRHPNIVSFYGACFMEEEAKIILVEEFVQGLKLRNVFSSHPVLDADRRHDILRGTCSAIAYLHGQKPAIVHSDLKPANIMLETGSLKPKLIDFGLSGFAKPGSLVMGGTTLWQPPEVLSAGCSASVACSTDIFALGRLMFFVLTGELPLQGVLPVDVMRLATQGEAPPLCWPAEASVHPPFQLLCSRCTSLSPSARPDAEAVIKELISEGVTSQSLRAREGTPICMTIESF